MAEGSPPEPTATTQRVAVDGVELFVQCYGEGPPLLLVHGLGSSGDDWAFQIGPLAKGFRLIVPDLRGCGRSGVPADGYAIAQFAADLWGLVDRARLDRIAVAGFSMGGAVALEMALQRPGAVERLVLINSLPSYRIDHWKKAAEYWLQVGWVRLFGMRRTARMIARRLFPHPEQAAMRARVVDVVGQASPAPYLRCAHALADWCAADRLDRLAAPVLMLAGEHDYTALEEKRRWAARLGADLAVVRGSRHGTPFDAIAATCACIEGFLSGEGLPEERALRRDSADQVPSAPPTLPPRLQNSALFDLLGVGDTPRRAG